MPDQFLTLTAATRAEPPKTKGSRFLGLAAPATTEADALAVVESARREHHAARHHVWAFRLGPDGAQWRGSDDGEPSGTGGRPLLHELESRGLTDAVVVVTRYYGGTKLGTGGLGRAYGEAASLVLDVAAEAGRIVQRTVRVPVTLRFAFADTSAAMRTLEAFDAEIRDQTYTEVGTTLALAVRQSQAEALAAAFVDATAGRGRVDLG
ncbi:MAG: YigZ family protein [Bacteroidota bacterium]